MSPHSDPGPRTPDPVILRARADHVLDHAVEAEGTAVVGGEDLGDAVRLELPDLVGDDHAAAAAEDLDVGSAALPEQVDHVGEELDVAALVGGHGDTVGVLLDRGVDDFAHRAVVAEVDDLGAVRLEQAPDDVDGGIVAVEQRRGGYKPHLVRQRWFLGHGDLPVRIVARRSRGIGARRRVTRSAGRRSG